MNTRQLQYVITVAEERSFSAAAEKLMISQPSLSQYIQKLEDELGSPLFERSVPIKLTYAGELYLNMARNVLAQEAELQERIAGMGKGVTGILKVGTGYLNSVTLLPRLIAEFRMHYPNVQVEVFEDTESELKSIADEGKLDLIIATSHFSVAAYEMVELYKEPFLLAVPARYGEIESEKSLIELAEGCIYAKQLDGMDFVRLPQGTLIRELTDSIFANNHVKPGEVVECKTAMSSYAMAKAGVGICMVPVSVCKSDYGQQLHYYELKEQIRQRHISLYYKKSNFLGKFAKDFIDISKKLFEKQ